MHKQDPKQNPNMHIESGNKRSKDGQKEIPAIIKPEPLIKEVSVSLKFSEKISYSEIKSVSIASSMGLREYQGDFCSFGELDLKNLPNGKGNFISVFDGHGGQETAKKASESVLNVFGKSMILANGDVQEALKETVKALVLLTSMDTSGSTLSLAYVPSIKNAAHIAVLGDSPVIVLDKNNKIIQSPEHNARSNLEERNRALMKGADFKMGYLFSSAGNGL